MSFIDDLRKWTQQQTAARGRAAAGSTRDAIERLRRDRVTNRAVAKSGQAVAPESLVGRGRAGATGIPGTYLNTVEHGWLTGNYAEWIIYTWSAITGYLSGLGVSIGTSGEYTSAIPTREVLDTPRVFSGLTRLLVQSLVGAGRRMSEILPDGWPDDPKQIGCIRSPDGVYWLTWASSAGILAARLSTPPAGSRLLREIQEGAYTGQDAEIADTMILGTQSLALVDGDPDIVELIPASDTDLVEFYADYAATMAWGWCWRHQRRGASDEHQCGAVCTNYRAIDPTNVSARYVSFDIVTRLATLTISWTDGVPSATLALGDEHSFFLGSQSAVATRKNLFVLVADNESTLKRRHTKLSELDTWTATDPPHHVLAWYDHTGTLQTITWNPDAAPVTDRFDDGDPEFDEVCDYAPVATGSSWVKTGYYERGYWEVSGTKLSRVPYGAYSTSSHTINVIIIDAEEHKVGCSRIRNGSYSDSSSINEHEHLVVAESPGVAWILGEEQIGATSFSYSGCSDQTAPSFFAYYCCNGYDIVPETDCTAGLDTDPRDIPVDAKMVVNGTEYAIDDGIRDAMLVGMASLKGGQVSYTYSAKSAPGYNGRNNIHGAPLATGLDATGAAEDGYWIGSA